ncbi:MAG TPA: hypothetical protein VKC63_07890 [Solirubrobacterales bacterium]|nr:hypothetical protein [Solirubrobacterales bacterium]
MKQLAPGVWRLKELPAPTINVYLADDVLIDAGRPRRHTVVIR